MSRPLKVAVVGATGAVGESLIELLAERDFPVAELVPLASKRSLGKSVSFKNKEIGVIELDSYDFAGVDVALFSAGGSISEEHAPRAIEAGAFVIDNTSAFRYHDEVPLVVPEVNGDILDDHSGNRLIANPNCSTIQMMVALAPIHREFGIQRITVSTYQSVSGSGKKGIEELSRQTADLLNFRSTANETYPQRIAFNVLPHIDVFLDNGYTKEEMKMVWETRKIMRSDTIQVNPTAVRVPVFYGHSEAIHIESLEPMSASRVREILQETEGIEVVDSEEEPGYPTPASHAAGQDAVYVGRIRDDLNSEFGVNLWVVGDNIRKGAALNAIQIAEYLRRIGRL